MPDPPGFRVVPLGEYLLHPLHDVRQFKPVLRPDVKREPVILKTELPNLEDKPKHSLIEHLCKDRQCPVAAKEGFPVIDPGTDFVPHSLSKYTSLSHRGYYGIDMLCCFTGMKKNEKTGGFWYKICVISGPFCVSLAGIPISK
jgi:hypothetical protein